MKLKSLSLCVLCLVVVLMGVGCKKSEDAQTNVVAALTQHTSCKASASAGQGKDGVKALSPDCVQYQYDGQGTLTLKHVNAGFNCCPGDITAQIDITGNVITIVELENQGGCHCLCLYDLDYEVTNLSTGQYTIRFVEPYANAGDVQLEINVILTSVVGSGENCVDRNYYPWAQ